MKNTKRIRGWILQLLSDAGTDSDGYCWQTLDRIRERLYDLSYDLTVGEVRAEATYLQAAKLVEVEKFERLAGRILGGSRTALRLTKLGVDVLEKTAVEPGVELGMC